MSRHSRHRFVALLARVRELYPGLADVATAIEAGHVQVDGRIVTNPRSKIRRAAAVRIRTPNRPRGAAKLEAALGAFDVNVRGRIAVDVGASTGGFTTVLLEAGAARVYAVDAGFGQLLGSLRLDQRVVSLERVNIGDITVEQVPELVDVITVDLSYLSVAEVAPQLGRLRIAEDADLIALVKPMYELGMGRLPGVENMAAEAVELASAGVERAGWEVRQWVPSPVRGRRGAAEALLHAHRRRPSVTAHGAWSGDDDG